MYEEDFVSRADGFYLENCFINLSGKRMGWQPSDALNERVVRYESEQYKPEH